MDYKKKSLSKLKKNESYEEIDTRLASGWYVDALSGNNKKKYKTKEVVFKISKKSEQGNFISITRNILRNQMKITRVKILVTNIIPKLLGLTN